MKRVRSQEGRSNNQSKASIKRSQSNLEKSKSQRSISASKSQKSHRSQKSQRSNLTDNPMQYENSMIHKNAGFSDAEGRQYREFDQSGRD